MEVVLREAERVEGRLVQLARVDALVVDEVVAGHRARQQRLARATVRARARARARVRDS